MAHGQCARALAVVVAVLTVVCVALIIALDSYHGEYLEAVGGGGAAEDRAGAEAEPEGGGGGGDGGSSASEAALVHPWEKEPRLSRQVVPLHYDLFLHPDLDSGTFMGKSDLLSLHYSDKTIFLDLVRVATSKP